MSARVDHAARAVELLAEVGKLDAIPNTSDEVSRVKIAAVQGFAAAAQVHATLAVAEQQRIANCLQVALVDQLTQIALTLPVPGYPTDPSVRIRDYLSPGDWEGLGL